MKINNWMISGTIACGKTRMAKVKTCLELGLISNENDYDESIFIQNSSYNFFSDDKRIAYIPINEIYDYSMFVEGIDIKASDNGLLYKRLDNTFLKICEKANNSNLIYALILDDIDRTNILSIFGELLYAIENRNVPISLQSGKKIVVPDNLVIIVTMSAIFLKNKPDYAFFRRFNQIEISSDSKILVKLINQGKITSRALDEYKLYNNFIEENISKSFRDSINNYIIGHGWFMASSDDELKMKIHHQVIPLLTEYIKQGILSNTEKVWEFYEKNSNISMLGDEKNVKIELVDDKRKDILTVPFDYWIDCMDSKSQILIQKESGKNINSRGAQKRLIEALINIPWKSELIGFEQLFVEFYSTRIGNYRNKNVSILMDKSHQIDLAFVGGGEKADGGTSNSITNLVIEIQPNRTIEAYYRINDVQYFPFNCGVIKNIGKKAKIDNINAISGNSSVELIKLCTVIIHKYYQIYKKNITDKLKEEKSQNLKELLKIVSEELLIIEELQGNSFTFTEYYKKIIDKNTGLKLLRSRKDGLISRKINGAVVSARVEGIYKMESSKYLKIMNKLNVHQMILQGPPGTSKTYGAKEFILKEISVDKELKNKEDEKILNACQIKSDWYNKSEKENCIDSQTDDKTLFWDIVQFHPSYGYEDFVRGISIKTSETNGNNRYEGVIDAETPSHSTLTFSSKNDNGIQYECINKTLGRIAHFAELIKQKDKKEDKKIRKVFLIIDEINRANISSVFGELIYALEYRDTEVATPYSVKNGTNESNIIKLPDNLYVIGTMNTADKSIGYIDYAVRRRFIFFPMLPNVEIVKEYNSACRDKNVLVFNEIAGLFDKYLNREFYKDDVQIGHTMFLADDEEELKYHFMYQIIPILREYYKDGVLIYRSEDSFNDDKPSEFQQSIMNYIKKYGLKEAEDLGKKMLSFI